MSLTFVLPWFPILLGVGVGGRLLGRQRGLYLGVVSALFWIVLTQASQGPGIWRDPSSVAALLAGALAIAAMGRWAGELPLETEAQSSILRSMALRHRNAEETAALSGAAGRSTALAQVSQAIERFDDWLGAHRHAGDPWPMFDVFLRSVLYECCAATHVQPFRLDASGNELLPLRPVDSLAECEPLPARSGILGHVLATGRPYLQGDPVDDTFVSRSAPLSSGSAERSLAFHSAARAERGSVFHDDRVNESQDSATGAQSALLRAPPVWCLPIRQAAKRHGVVAVGHLGIAPEANRVLLRTMEGLINQFWCTLHETMLCRSAVHRDPVSGLLTRPAFLASAGHVLHESYHHDEPVAAAVIAFEGLRDLSDTGRWETADEIVRQASALLLQKARTDDRVGRFDGSRLVLLMRRVDSALASLILTQVQARIAKLCGDEQRWGVKVTVRCGLAASAAHGSARGAQSSPSGHPDLPTLLSNALSACRRARLDGVAFVDGSAGPSSESAKLRSSTPGVPTAAEATG